MITRYNNISLALGAPGLILQGVGVYFVNVVQPPNLTIGAPLSLAGTGLLLAGFAFYAKAKGRHPAWCLMAFLGLIGLIVLACLKDLAPEGREKRRRYDEDDFDEDDRPRRRRRARDDELDDDEFEEDPPMARKRNRDDFEDEAIQEVRLVKPAPPQAPAPVPAVTAPAAKIVQCARCQKQLRIPAGATGKKVRCPACGEVFAAN